MSGPVRPPLTVETVDGTTVGRPITTIKVTNGDLTVSGNVATIDTSGGGGGMTSFDVAGDAGATQTVGNGDTLTLQGSGGITKVTMSATDTATISLENTAVTPGSYTLASITVDAQGRITAASSGSVSVPSGANPTAEVSGTAVNGTAGTFMRSDAAPALADTAVTPNTYTYSTITVDQQGRITSASSGTAPTVDGSGATNQVAVWSDADTLTGYATLTFDGSNLEVGGYVKSGGTYDTSGATDLTLKTNGGTNSGTLTLKNGAGGNLVFDPTGAGLLQIEGTTNPGAIKLMCEAGTHGITIESAPHSASATYKLVLPDALPADADNKYLVSDTSGNMSFTSAGGGGVTFPLEATDGSAAAPSYSFASDTNTGIFRENADTISFTVGGTRKIQFNTDGIKMVSGQVQAEGTTLTSGGGYAFSGDTDTGMEKYFANYLTLRTAGSPRFTIGSSGQILIGGTTSGNDGDAGTSGQVLTSAGASSPPTWETPSGGGSGGIVGVLPKTGSTSEDQYNLGTAPPWGMGGNDSTAGMTTLDKPFAFPFIAPETGTVSAIGVRVVSSASQNAYVAIYSQDSNNLPSTRLGYATIDLSSTGNIYQTSITGTISLTAGTQYYYSVSSDSAASATLNASGFVDGLPNLGISSSLTENPIAIKDNSTSSYAVPPASFTASFGYSNFNRVHVAIKY